MFPKIYISHLAFGVSGATWTLRLPRLLVAHQKKLVCIHALHTTACLFAFIRQFQLCSRSVYSSNICQSNTSKKCIIMNTKYIANIIQDASHY